MIGGNDDDNDECIFGEGERIVDLSLRKREKFGIFGIPFATCTDRSLSSAAAADMSRGKKTQRKKKEVLRYELGQETKANWKKLL